MTRILMVDDIAENRYLLKALFAGNGYEVTSARNGLEALELAGQAPPDLIITDILMPDMDGFELCRRWKSHPQLRDLPFVFYTATYTDPKDEQFALSLGADRFIVKPQQPEILVAIVSEVLVQARAGRISRPAQPAGGENDTLLQYNEALFRKLERKIAQLEAETLERQRLSEQLLQSQKLEVVGRLVSGVAHDFNNILTVTLYSADRLKEGLPGDSSLLQPLGDIFDATERAIAITKQLLSFSGSYKSEPELVAPDDVLAKLTRILGRLLGEHIIIEVVLGEAPVVRIDPVRLEQVVLNLAVNARDAMPEGGTLSITTRSSPDGCVIEIGDSGCGIPPENLSQILEPFFTTKPRGRGTGLGLSVTSDIIKEAGGTLEVESQVGVGTKFLVKLPAAQPNTASDVRQPLAPRQPELGRGETILLIENDPSLRFSLSRILEQAGYSPIAASHGRQALDILSLRPAAVRLVLADVVMPEMEGQALLTELARSGNEVPVLLMSGFPEEFDSRDEVTTRAKRQPTELLRKPVEKPRLLGAIRRLLDNASQNKIR